MRISLVRPTSEYKDKAADFKREFFDNGEFTINGSELLDMTNDYEK